LKKKPGSALIMVLAVMALLTILCGAILTEAVMANKAAIVNKKVDKLTLIAESGIEKGLTQLKQKLHDTPNIFVQNINFSATDFTFTESAGNITCTVHYEDILNYDHQGQCVAITSTAKYDASSTKKTMKAYILKKDISNEYYDKIFGNVFTALDDVNGNTSNTFTMGNGVNDLKLDGNMYLQGGSIDLKPSNISYTSGSVNVNANSYDTITSSTNFLRAMNVYTVNAITNNTIKNNVKKLTPTKLDILSIITTTSADSELSDFYTGSRYTNPNSNYNILACKQNSVDDSGHTVTTLVTFKVVKKATAPSNSVFDWSAFVVNVKDYIMRNMLGFTGTPSGNSYGNYYENLYKGMYKLYIIQGDVKISQATNTSSYINHIIYSTSTVTIDNSNGNNNFILNNSSIMANKIIINNLTVNNSTGYWRDNSHWVDNGHYEEEGHYVWKRVPDDWGWGWHWEQVWVVEQVWVSNWVYVEDKVWVSTGGSTMKGKIELYGINQLDETLYGGGLSPFSAGNRANINRFLILHLNGYADALKFKVYKWEES